jgi:hypothetical protein
MLSFVTILACIQGVAAGNTQEQPALRWEAVGVGGWPDRPHQAGAGGEGSSSRSWSRGSQEDAGAAG